MSADVIGPLGIETASGLAFMPDLIEGAGYRIDLKAHGVVDGIDFVNAELGETGNRRPRIHSHARANSNAEKAEIETLPEFTPPRILQREEAAIFIHVIHSDACQMFGTVLGPNANAAHKDHFHLDMAKRRYASVCK